MSDDNDKFSLGSRAAIALTTLALATGGGGTYFARDYFFERTDERLQALEQQVRLFAISGPSEVRAALNRIEQRIARECGPGRRY